MTSTCIEDILAKLPPDERARVEAACNAAQQFRLLFDATSDIIYFKDRDHKFTAINQAHAKWLDLAHPDLAIGKTDKDFYTPTQAAKFFADEEEVMQGKPVIRVLEEVERAGQHLTFSTTKLPIMQNGTVQGIMGINRDITELIDAQSARVKEILRLTYAHALNNDLQGIGPNIELALSQLPADSIACPALRAALTGYAQIITHLAKIGDLPTNYPTKQYGSSNLTHFDLTPSNAERLVLIADDEPSIVSFLTAVAKRQNYQVVGVGNGDDAVRNVVQHKFSVIFLDYNMPGQNGLQVLSQIQKMYEQQLIPAPAVIMITGYDANVLDTAKQHSCFYDGLHKPIPLNIATRILNEAYLAVSEKRHPKPI